MSDTAAVENTQSVEFIPLNLLKPFTLGNSRVTHNKANREQLLESIKSKGVVTPITVRPTSDNSGYEVVAGFGRWEASIKLEFDTIPALIRPMSDNEAYEIQLTENLVRDGLTLVDECKAAQKFVSRYEGDHTAAANRLGWNSKKLNERLELLRCSDKVLDALNTGTIKIGHAVILSSFSSTLQDGTLQKIIDEKWTVKTLKERASRAKKYLHTAKFDTSECNGCAHNTRRQLGMFDTEQESKDQCAKLSCWKEKTDKWLNEQRVIAEEKYGKVLLLVESGEEDRSTVAEENVGVEQFKNCSGCESRVAIMDDRYPHEGEITESQCLDKVCFKKCSSRHLNTSKKVKPSQSNPSGNGSLSLADKAQSTTEKPTQKTPASVTLHERNTIRNKSQEIIKEKSWFKLAVQLASLVSSTGYKSPLFDSISSFNERVKACSSVSEDTIRSEIDLAINFLAQTHKDDNAHSSNNPTDLMIQSLVTVDNYREVAISAWICDEKTLKNYTVQGLVALCQQSKFDVAFENDPINIQKKITFNKISSKSKPQFIQAILNFEFAGWQSFAPQTYLSHLK